MTWTAITKPAQGASTKKTSFADAVIDDLTHLYNLSGGSGSGAGGVLQNGSFENDVDSDGIPDGWTQTLGAGGAAAFDTTTPAHGAQAYKFTTPGSVDNYLETTDYILCAVPNTVVISFLLKCSAAGVAADVVIRWFDMGKSYLSSSTVYSEGAANPTAWSRIVAIGTPPTAACYYKIRLYGGVAGDATAGDVYFDGVEIIQQLLIGRGAFTLTEQSTSSSTFVDAGSASITLPYFESSKVVVISFESELKTGGSGTAQQRWRIGAYYSNEQSNATGTYVKKTYQIILVTTGGPQTIYQQLLIDSGVAYGRKADADTSMAL